MTDDIFDNVMLIISNFIIGAVLIFLGVTLHLPLLILLGGIVAGGIPIGKLIQVIMSR